MSIQRYEFMVGDKPARLDDGPWVKYADHQAEVDRIIKEQVKEKIDIEMECVDLEKKLSVAIEMLNYVEESGDPSRVWEAKERMEKIGESK